jgi:hypothetical protein
MIDRDAYIERGREVRRSHMNEEYLSMQLTLKIALAQRGWYEFLEPDEGENTAIAHQDDFETYIVGYVLDDSVVLEPGQDHVRIYARDYLTADLFVVALKTEFDRLVKEWYPE